jgi:bisphosphoglycerate-dependent phosphoglycerate mutase
MDNNEVIKKKYGAWKKQTSKGEVISFTIEDKKYSMWVNTYKTQPNQPDYQIYEDNFVPAKDKENLPF